MLAKQWYQCSIECLNNARYQQNHSCKTLLPLYERLLSSLTYDTSVQCADHCKLDYLRPYTRVIASNLPHWYILIIVRFSNSQSVLLASAVRIAQALGLHRLTRTKRGSYESDGENATDVVQKELGRRIWHQLAVQDWFSVPFSETYCEPVRPMHYQYQVDRGLLTDRGMQVLIRCISQQNCLWIATKTRWNRFLFLSRQSRLTAISCSKSPLSCPFCKIDPPKLRRSMRNMNRSSTVISWCENSFWLSCHLA